MLSLARALKRTGAAGFLVIYLIGVTGLSVSRHTCSMSNRETVAFYAGIYRKAPGSCCGDEDACMAGSSHPGLILSFNAIPCCRNVNTFLVLNVPTENQDRLALPGISPVPAPPSQPAANSRFEPCPVVQYIFYRYHSPPRSGKQLVHYLHQIKIPALPDLV